MSSAAKNSKEAEKIEVLPHSIVKSPWGINIASTWTIENNHWNFTGIGLAVEHPETIVKAYYSDNVELECPSENLRSIADSYLKAVDAEITEKSDLRQKYRVEVEKVVESAMTHGSKLILGLAIGQAINRLYSTRLTRLKLIPEKIAEIIKAPYPWISKVYSFRFGGFVISGGRLNGKRVPPLLVRYNFPENCFIVLGILKKEVKFQDFPKIENADLEKRLSEEVNWITLVRLLPAVVEQNVVEIGKALSEIGKIILSNESYLNLCQKLMSSSAMEAVKESTKLLLEEGALGASQSMFEPVVYGLVDELKKGEALSDSLKKFLEDYGGGEVLLTKPNNSGAVTHYTILKKK